MKQLNKLLFAVLISAAPLFSQPAGNEGFYVLQDHQYYKPMLADIRRPAFHTRFYYDEAVKFSNLGAPGKAQILGRGIRRLFPAARL